MCGRQNPDRGVQCLLLFEYILYNEATQMYTAKLANHRRRITKCFCHCGSNYLKDGAEADASVSVSYGLILLKCQSVYEIRKPFSNPGD